jgi:hypothetical protein
MSDAILQRIEDAVKAVAFELKRENDRKEAYFAAKAAAREGADVKEALEALDDAPAI